MENVWLPDDTFEPAMPEADKYNFTIGETFEKRSILFKAKEGENFNHRNTLSILRIKI